VKVFVLYKYNIIEEYELIKVKFYDGYIFVMTKKFLILIK